MRVWARFCIPLVAAAIVGSAQTANAGILISVDKTAQRMTVIVDGVRRYNWPVSTGGPGYDTPSGKYTPFRMERKHFSKEWDDAPMPHSIFFTQAGHAIHGSYQTRRLGSPVSHGCIRLAPFNAARLFALVKAEGMGNVRVQVSGANMGRVKHSKSRPRKISPPPQLGPEWQRYYQPMPSGYGPYYPPPQG